MINPHGSQSLNPLYVADDARRAELAAEAENLPSIIVSSATAASAVMLACGYFNPLKGYMNLAESLSVAKDMKTADGLFWPVPVTNIVQEADLTDELRGASRIALRDPNVDGNPVIAIQTVVAIETLSDEDRDVILEEVFRTKDPEHPGVAALVAQGNQIISGDIEVLNYSYFPVDFPGTFRTAVQIREEIAEMGWDKCVAFQTRNPMHRAHEELCRMAKNDLNADGILIHMLLGKLKPGDIPAHVRDAAIRKMAELYFPENTVLITGYGFDMLYAGPREALLHAVFRQNCGCSHLIVGRDHAGVGKYYGAFDAQTIFDEIPKGALEIEIFRGDFTLWSKKLHKIVMMRDHPDHSQEDYIFLSGTKVREMLSNGEMLPEEFARPEVAEILMKYYQEEAAVSS